jgi:TBC1 domain family protein 5
MDADYNTALTLLLRYPSLEDGKSPQEFVTNAVYLRNNFNHAGASTLVEKYSGRPLPEPTETPTTTLQPSMPGSLRMQMPGRASSNFEDILQGAAKGVFQRGEKWGINKAFRDAMDEVRKGVREIQAVQTSQEPPRHARGLSRQSGTSDRSTNPSLQLTVLEQRNTALSKMLKKAIDDLWTYHESAVEGKASEEDSLKGLSMAIAKVQFVQVYLEDASVPLSAEEDATETSKEDVIEVTEVQPQIKAPASAHTDNKLAAQDTEKPADTKATDGDATKSVEAPAQELKQAAPSKTTRTADIPLDFHTPRPTLAQSSFSWMLGQSPETSSASSFAQAKGLAPSDIRRRSKGFLFGEDDDARAGSPEKKKDSKRGKDRKKQVKKEVLFEQEPVEEEFDLGALEEEKKAGKEKAKAGA